MSDAVDITVMPSITQVTVTSGVSIPAASASVLGGVLVPGGDIGGTAQSMSVASIQGTVISAPPGGTTQFLAGNGTWQTPPGTGVALTGNQTVAGVKTFTSPPSIPDGVALTDGASVEQVSGLWTPRDQGFAAWTFPWAYAGSTGTPSNAGAIRYGTLRLLGNATVTKLFCYVTSAGSGLTAGQNFLALFNYSTLALIAQSGDVTSQFLTTGMVTGTISSQSLAPGRYIIGLWVNGTTAPTLATANSAAGPANANLTAGSPYAFGQGNTGVTTTAPGTLVINGTTVVYALAMG